MDIGTFEFELISGKDTMGPDFDSHYKGHNLGFRFLVVVWVMLNIYIKKKKTIFQTKEEWML